MFSAFFSRRASYVIATFAAILLVAACSGGGSSSGGGAGSFNKGAINGNVQSGVALYQNDSGKLFKYTFEFVIPKAHADSHIEVCAIGPVTVCDTADSSGNFSIPSLPEGDYNIEVNGVQVMQGNSPVVIPVQDGLEYEVKISNGQVIEIESEEGEISGEISEDSESEDSESEDSESLDGESEDSESSDTPS